jgi:hypothetical protein
MALCPSSCFLSLLKLSVLDACFQVCASWTRSRCVLPITHRLAGWLSQQGHVKRPLRSTQTRSTESDCCAERHARILLNSMRVTPGKHERRLRFVHDTIQKSYGTYRYIYSPSGITFQSDIAPLASGRCAVTMVKIWIMDWLFFLIAYCIGDSALTLDKLGSAPFPSSMVTMAMSPR